MLPKPVWSMHTINILYMIFHVRIRQNDDAAELRSRLFAGSSFLLENEFRENELFSDVWQCNGK